MTARRYVKPGDVCRFDPVGFDVFDRRDGQPAPGSLVRVIRSPFGCPPLGAMGHGYVEPLGVSDGRAVLVQLASLQRIEEKEGT